MDSITYALSKIALGSIPTTSTIYLTTNQSVANLAFARLPKFGNTWEQPIFQLIRDAADRGTEGTEPSHHNSIGRTETSLQIHGKE